MGTESSFFTKVFIDPIKTFFYTFKLLSDLRKGVGQFSFSAAHQTKTQSEIEILMHKLLQEKLVNYGVGMITSEVEQNLVDHINQSFKEYACAASNEKVQNKLQELTEDFLKDLNISSLYDNTQKDILDYLNEGVQKYACNDEYKKIHTKLESISDKYVESLTKDILLSETRKSISDFINYKSTQWACRDINEQVVEKAENLSRDYVTGFGKKDIYEQTEKSIQNYLNENILNHTHKDNNKIVQKRVQLLHDEFIAKLDSNAITSETRKNILSFLNSRISEQSDLPANKEMVKKAEQLLLLFLEQCQNLEIIKDETTANMNKKLNHIILQVLNTSGKVDDKALQIFNEILGNIHNENIDPIVRMQIESALYNVITKELSVYGNENLVQKAVELMHEFSKRIPHESSVNDLIMQHNTRKTPTI